MGSHPPSSSYFTFISMSHVTRTHPLLTLSTATVLLIHHLHPNGTIIQHSVLPIRCPLLLTYSPFVVEWHGDKFLKSRRPMPGAGAKRPRPIALPQSHLFFGGCHFSFLALLNHFASAEPKGGIDRRSWRVYHPFSFLPYFISSLLLRLLLLYSVSVFISVIRI